MLIINSPIGSYTVLPSIESKLVCLSNDELIELAIEENKNFCISPEVYALIELRKLEHVLQNKINPNLSVGKLLNLK